MRAPSPVRLDPCASCPDTTCEAGFGCPVAPLPACAHIESCEYAEDCMGGDLCGMLRPDLAQDDTEYATEAQELAEAWAVAK